MRIAAIQPPRPTTTGISPPPTDTNARPEKTGHQTADLSPTARLHRAAHREYVSGVAERADRLAALRAQVADDTYEVNRDTLCDAMLDEVLQGGSK